MLRLNAGWDRWARSAARAKCSSSASSTACCNWCSFRGWFIGGSSVALQFLHCSLKDNALDVTTVAPYARRHHILRRPMTQGGMRERGSRTRGDATGRPVQHAPGLGVHDGHPGAGAPADPAAARDAAAGLNTGGYVSGYRGSPLGRYDMELWAAQDAARSAQHRFPRRPSTRTSRRPRCGASQYVGVFPGAKVDGVFGIWYGKGPGVDRSGDVLRHANSAGTSALGRRARASPATTTARSRRRRQLLRPDLHRGRHAGAVPVQRAGDARLRPARHRAVAATPAAGSGMKVVTDVVEGGGTVDVGARLARASSCRRTGRRRRWTRAAGASVPVDMALPQEERLYHHKLACGARLRARQRAEPDHARRAGAARSASSRPARPTRTCCRRSPSSASTTRAGASSACACAKVGLSGRSIPASCGDFAAGLDTILVVEEKRPLLEDQMRSVLYDAPLARRPRDRRQVRRRARVGRRARRRACCPNVGELAPPQIARALVDCLRALDPDCGVLPACRRGAAAAAAPASRHRCARRASARAARTTARRALPDGSARARRHRLPHHGDVPESGADHDRLAHGRRGRDVARPAAVHRREARVRQHRRRHVLPLGLPRDPAGGRGQGADHLQAAVQRLRVDDRRAADRRRPAGRRGWPRELAGRGRAGSRRGHRRSRRSPRAGRCRPASRSITASELDAVQRRAARLPRRVGARSTTSPAPPSGGACASAASGRIPTTRTFINAAVCEGCGDCGKASNCLSIEPLETPFGRKRRINQASCNKDFSCVEGFCPSFVTVHGGRLRKAARRARPAGAAADPAPLPRGCPSRRSPGPTGVFSVLVAGIGGTGVVTIGQIARHGRAPRRPVQRPSST